MSSRFFWICFSLCLTSGLEASLAIATFAAPSAPEPVHLDQSTGAATTGQDRSNVPVTALDAIAAAPDKLTRKAHAVAEPSSGALPSEDSSEPVAVDAAPSALPEDPLDNAAAEPVVLAAIAPGDAPGAPPQPDASEAATSAPTAIAQATDDDAAEMAPEPTDDDAAERRRLFQIDIPSLDTLDAESRQIVESLRANPNPLLYPTVTEEVEIIGSQPLTLTQAYAIAAQNNRNLQIALLQLDQARLALREQEAQNFPSLDVSGGLTATENNQQANFLNPGPFDDINVNLNGTVGLSYDVFTSGRRPALIEAAERQVRSVELEVERFWEDVRLQVASAYYAMQESDELVRINSAFLDQARQSQRDAQIREEAGVGTRFDVLQADVEVANAQQRLTEARSQQVIARRRLAQILNVPHTVTLEATAVLPDRSWPLTLEESLILSFQNRAELERFLVERELNEQQRRSVLANLGPQVQVFAQYSVDNLLNDETEDFVDQYSFGARLNWNLFDGGAARARAGQSEKAIEIAETEFAQTLYEIRLDVEENYYDQLAQFANIDTSELAVTQAAEALRIARLRFQAGVGTQLEVIQAQSNLTEAEANRVRAIVGYNQAIANLRRAISNLPESRLLPSLEIPPASNFTMPLSLSDYEDLVNQE